MFLEFVIIPVSATNESSAYELFNNIKRSVKNEKEIDIIIDTSYFASLKTRISKHRRKNKDIIIIDNDFDRTNNIKIKFSGLANQPTQISIDELIELIISLEEEEEIAVKEELSKSELTKEEEPNQSSCFIM
jgi:hypothetical protein